MTDLDPSVVYIALHTSAPLRTESHEPAGAGYARAALAWGDAKPLTFKSWWTAPTGGERVERMALVQPDGSAAWWDMTVDPPVRCDPPDDWTDESL